MDMTAHRVFELQSDWLTDLKDGSWESDYGSQFSEWVQDRPDAKVETEIGEVVLEFLGSDDWRHHPEKIRDAIEKVLESFEFAFEQHLYEQNEGRG